MNLSTPLALSTLVHGALLTAAFAVGVYMVPDRSEADYDRLARIEIFTPPPAPQIELAMFDLAADEEDEAEELAVATPEPEAEPVVEPEPEVVEEIAAVAPTPPAPRPEPVAEPEPEVVEAVEEIAELKPVVEAEPVVVADKPDAVEMASSEVMVETTYATVEGNEHGETSASARAWSANEPSGPTESINPAPQAVEVDLYALEASYVSALNRAIQGAYHYPRLARRAGLEGTVLIRISIASDGKILETEVVRSSGHGVLDRAAVEAIASIQTFPSPPDELALARSEHTFDIPVEYSLSASL